MSLPSVVWVGPMAYKVLVVVDLMDGGRKLDGHIKYTEQVIFIDENNVVGARWQLLWHEILHAIVTQGGLEMTETELDVLAYGVVDVLRQNKEMGEGCFLGMNEQLQEGRDGKKDDNHGAV